MHELAVAQRLVAMIVEEAVRSQAHKIERVRLRLGHLSHVEPSSLELAFAAASRGTLADGAELQIERTSGAARCLLCGAQTVVARHGAACSACGECALLVEGGEELRLVSLEVS